MASKANRATVGVTLAVIEENISLDTLAALIQQAQARASAEGIWNVSLSIDTERGYYDSVTVNISITGVRYETDEEMELRLAHSRQSSVNAKAERLKLYKKLQREFE